MGNPHLIRVGYGLDEKIGSSLKGAAPVLKNVPLDYTLFAEYDGVSMRPLPPAPNVPGNTDAERMSNALNMVLKVSKSDLLKEEARLKAAHEKKRVPKKPAS